MSVLFSWFIYGVSFLGMLVSVCCHFSLPVHFMYIFFESICLWVCLCCFPGLFMVFAMKVCLFAFGIVCHFPVYLCGYVLFS